MRTLFAVVIVFALLCPLSIHSQEKKEKEENGNIVNYKDTTGKEEIETEEVVVTGTRTYKKIIDIPYSVFRVEKNEMTYGRNVNARDVLADVPGLFLQSRYGNDVRISIRGFGTRSNSGVRGIRILQDGIPESEPDGETAIDAIDFTSLGGIEVVKGNQSSLYTNSPGGVVNFISDVQFTQNFVRMTNEIGNYGLYQNGLKIGLISNKFRYFLSYSYRNFDGYRPHSTEFIHLINTVFDNYIDNKTTLSIYGNFVRGKIKLPGSLTKEEFDADPYQAYEVAVSSDYKRNTEKGRIAARFTKFFGRNDQHEMEITGFGGIKNLDFTTNNLYYVTTKYKLGAMFRYTSRIPIAKRENEFTAGIDYFYLDGPVSAYSNTGGIKGDDLQSEIAESLSNIGAYFLEQLTLIRKKVSFLFSGRWDKIAYTNNNQLFSLQNSTRSFDRFTPKFAVNFKVVPLVALYASYGLGFDSPASVEMENYPLSSNQGTTTLNPDINPQKSSNFELGIKGNIMREEEKRKDRTKKKEKEDEFELFEKLFFEATFFNIKTEDEIVPFVVTDRTYFRNAATTNRTGVEFGIKAELLEGLEILTNYTITDFKYKEYTAKTIDINGMFHDTTFSNNIMPAVPKHQLGCVIEYKYKFSKNFFGLLTFDFDYVSKLYTDDMNSEQADSYLYANPMGGINLIFGNLSFLLAGGEKNIFNKKYVGFININADPEKPIGHRRYYELGEPRSGYLNLNLTYRF